MLFIVVVVCFVLLALIRKVFTIMFVCGESNSAHSSNIYCSYLSSVEKSSDKKSEEVAKEPEKAADKPETPVTRGSASRKAINHKYSKLEAKPLRRSSISATRKSDRGMRRLFVHKQKPEEKKQILLSPEAPLKPPRAQQVDEPRIVEEIPVAEENGKGMRTVCFL